MNILDADLHSFYDGFQVSNHRCTLHPRHRRSPYCHLDHSTLRLSNPLALSFPFRVSAPDSLPHPSFCTCVCCTPRRTTYRLAIDCDAPPRWLAYCRIRTPVNISPKSNHCQTRRCHFIADLKFLLGSRQSSTQRKIYSFLLDLLKALIPMAAKLNTKFSFSMRLPLRNGLDGMIE